MRRLWIIALTATAFGTAALCQTTPAPRSQAQQIDLTKTFDTRSPWRLVGTEGPPVEDAIGELSSGALGICLEKVSGGACVSGVVLQQGDTETAPLWGP